MKKLVSILCVFCLLLALTAAVTLLLIRRKRKGGMPPQTEQTPTEHDPPDQTE